MTQPRHSPPPPTNIQHYYSPNAQINTKSEYDFNDELQSMNTSMSSYDGFDLVPSIKKGNNNNHEYYADKINAFNDELKYDDNDEIVDDDQMTVVDWIPDTNINIQTPMGEQRHFWVDTAEKIIDNHRQHDFEQRKLLNNDHYIKLAQGLQLDFQSIDQSMRQKIINESDIQYNGNNPYNPYNLLSKIPLKKIQKTVMVNHIQKRQDQIMKRVLQYYPNVHLPDKCVDATTPEDPTECPESIMNWFKKTSPLYLASFVFDCSTVEQHIGLFIHWCTAVHYMICPRMKIQQIYQNLWQPIFVDQIKHFKDSHPSNHFVHDNMKQQVEQWFKEAFCSQYKSKSYVMLQQLWLSVTKKPSNKSEC